MPVPALEARAIVKTFPGIVANDVVDFDVRVGEIHALLHYCRTEKIFEAGLHEWLLEFLEKIGALNAEVDKQSKAEADKFFQAAFK